MTRPCVQVQVLLDLLQHGPSTAMDVSIRIQRSYERSMSSIHALQRGNVAKLSGYGQRTHGRGLTPYVFDVEDWVRGLVAQSDQSKAMLYGSTDKFKKPLSAYDLNRRN